VVLVAAAAVFVSTVLCWRWWCWRYGVGGESIGGSSSSSSSSSSGGSEGKFHPIAGHEGPEGE
jgi:hypothetical protein